MFLGGRVYKLLEVQRTRFVGGSEFQGANILEEGEADATTLWAQPRPTHHQSHLYCHQCITFTLDAFADQVRAGFGLIMRLFSTHPAQDYPATSPSPASRLRPANMNTGVDFQEVQGLQVEGHQHFQSNDLITDSTTYRRPAS